MRRGAVDAFADHRNSRNRAALLSSSSTSPGVMTSRAGARGQAPTETDAYEYAAAYEQQNNRQVDALSGKVQAMREVALQINDEATSQNRYLDQQMVGVFDHASVSLRQTMQQLDHLVRSGSGRHLCYMVAGVVALLFLLYLLFPR